MAEEIDFFNSKINEVYSCNDFFYNEDIGLEISVEYYGFSLDNFQREILHGFKPRFAAGKLSADIQPLVKKQDP